MGDLVQCDKTDSGCKGGLMDNAFEFVKSHGIASENAYPYTSGGGTTGSCNSAKEGQPVVSITGYTDVPSRDEDALKSAVSQQPVSAAFWTTPRAGPISTTVSWLLGMALM